MTKINDLCSGFPNEAEIRFVKQDEKQKALVIGWSKKNYGFGEFTFIQDETGQLFLDTERSKPETVKEVLSWLVDQAIKDTNDNPDAHRRYVQVMRQECGDHCRVCHPHA